MELLCKNTCTDHEIIVEKNDEEIINSFVDSYELKTVDYNYEDDEIVIKLKQVN
tara:strand:- start:341 stop:502 length:162 start_codon:yes stop_codon:yes gene_type:complete